MSEPARVAVIMSEFEVRYSDGRREKIDPARVRFVDGGYLVEVDRGVTLKNGDALLSTLSIKR